MAPTIPKAPSQFQRFLVNFGERRPPVMAVKSFNGSFVVQDLDGNRVGYSASEGSAKCILRDPRSGNIVKDVMNENHPPHVETNHLHSANLDVLARYELTDMQQAYNTIRAHRDNQPSQSPNQEYDGIFEGVKPPSGCNLVDEFFPNIAHLFPHIDIQEGRIDRIPLAVNPTITQDRPQKGSSAKGGRLATLNNKIAKKVRGLFRNFRKSKPKSEGVARTSSPSPIASSQALPTAEVSIIPSQQEVGAFKFDFK